MRQLMLSGFAISLAIACCQGQTQVDLKTQSRGVDFTNATTTKPFKAGGLLPGACSTGEAFFLTTAPSGVNLYACVAENQWAQQGGAIATPNFGQAFSAATDITLNHNRATRDVIPFCVTETGQAVEWNSYSVVNENRVVVRFAVPQSGRCTVSTASGGIGGSGGDTVAAGIGIVIAGTPTKTISVDPAVVPGYLSAATSLNFPPISASTCSELTLTLTGALNGDVVIAGWPNTLEAGLIGQMFVSSPNTVTVRLCKITAGSVDPANQGFRATIVRGL